MKSLKPSDCLRKTVARVIRGKFLTFGEYVRIVNNVASRAGFTNNSILKVVLGDVKFSCPDDTITACFI